MTSRLWLFPLAALSCQEPEGGRGRFVEDQFARTSPVEYAGEAFAVDVAGVPAPINGGLDIVATDPDLKFVYATARLVAVADLDDKANADLTIIDVEESFRIETAGGTVRVGCGRGRTHGTSNGEESGCELVQVGIPEGKQDRRLSVGARAGRGPLRASIEGVVASIDLRTADGRIDATLPASAGATISLVSEGVHDVVLKLPPDFAADEIVASAQVVSEFDDAKIGPGAGGRGARGAGLARLVLASRGTIYLAR